MTPEELEALLNESVGEPFLRRFLAGVFVAFKNAHDHCGATFAEPEVKNLEPNYRRALIEGYMRDAAALHPDLTAAAMTVEGTPWIHSEVRGGSILLTASAVQRAGGMVNRAEFRATHARGGQLSFEPEEDEGGPIYAVLTYCRSVWLSQDDRREFGHLPGSVYLGFPAADLSGYVHKFNLFERYSDVVRTHTPDAMDGDAVLRFIDRSNAARYRAG